MKIVAAILACLALAGCATIGPAPVAPAQLLTCQPQPPSPAAATQRDVGLYLIDLAAAGDDCRAKLEAVRGLLEPTP